MARRRAARTGPRWASRTAGVVGLGLALLSAGGARGGELEDVHRKLTDLEERVRVLGADFRDLPQLDPNVADRRVIDAEVLFSLKNYNEAATILLDVIEKYPQSRAYDDAVVLLGESLYQDRDLNSARHYFELAVKKNTGSRREQAALQRLLEIALRTGNYDNVEEYLGRLERIPPHLLEPFVPYVRAKYAYFRDKLDEALNIFGAIAPSSPHYLQARYFMATIQVRKGDLAGAANGFDGVLRLQPRSDDEKQIQDLARMAIGRLYYERGQFEKAKESYASIPRQSTYFSDAMYESAWNAIKAGDFKAAYRSLDLMLLQNPDSPQAPEIRLLMGNLSLRLANYYVASETFSQARDEFEPIHRQLKETGQKAAADGKYFEALLGKGLEKFDIAIFIPAKAVKWVRTEPDVEQMLNLVTDVGDVQRGLRESEDLLQRLQRAVNGEGKVGLFPDLSSVRLKSTEVLSQTLDVRRRFLGRLRALITPQLAPDEKVALEQISSERSAFERQLRDLPLTAEGLKSRLTAQKGELNGLDGRASEMNVQIQALEAELVAIEQYYIYSRAEQKIRPEDLKTPVDDLKALITELRAQNERIRNEISEVSREATVAGASGQQERTAAARMTELMNREREVFQRARSRLSGGDLNDFDAFLNVLNRSDGVQSALVTFDGRVDAAADRRLVAIRDQLKQERTNLDTAGNRMTGIMSESQSLGGGLAQTMLSRVTDRFYDLVVQSDVGIVDVSWGLKDQKTSTLNKLINQQKLELKSVEDDFKSLLEEEK